MEQVKKLADIVRRQESIIEWYRDRTRIQTEIVDQLQDKTDDLERVKQYAGADQVQKINSMKETEQIEQEQRRMQMQRNRDWGMSR